MIIIVHEDYFINILKKDGSNAKQHFTSQLINVNLKYMQMINGRGKHTDRGYIN